MSEFAGKRALVTGASSGIGRATATLLKERGATLLVTGRRADALKSPTMDDGWTSLAGDLTSTDFRARLVEHARSRLGGLDVLVNAAGILKPGTWETTDLDAFDRILDVNLRTVFDLCRRAIPLLLENKGAIVNVSSVNGLRAFPGVLAYNVSKAGVDQLTRCLALELAPQGVRVNAVNPGVVLTELHRRGGMDEKTYEAFLEHSKSTHPLGRAARPEEVADLIAFLASERAGFITGDSVAIDGGRAQTCAR